MYCDLVVDARMVVGRADERVARGEQGELFWHAGKFDRGEEILAHDPPASLPIRLLFIACRPQYGNVLGSSRISVRQRTDTWPSPRALCRLRPALRQEQCPLPVALGADMALDDRKVRSERGETDESLRIERKNTDRALQESQAAVEADADAVLRLARGKADDLVLRARDKADQQLVQAAPVAGARATITKERTQEDKALRDERATADATLQVQRDEDARLLARLLPLERAATDRNLLIERDRSDDALSNRDDFLGIVSHDLRDLLSGILMSTAVLSKRAPQGAEGAPILAETSRIQRYVARMNRLIGDLIDVGSIDAGKLAVTPTYGDSASLIAEAVDTFAAMALAKDVSLAMEGAEHPLPGKFDRGRIFQVLANLIANSIKFTLPGGKIRVRGERAGDELRFCVSDTGPGIPGDMLEAIFERFWQVGKSDRRGLGLGLYISRCLVEAHGGKIWAESKPGEGSTFRFTLPCVGAGDQGRTEPDSLG